MFKKFINYFRPVCLGRINHKLLIYLGTDETQFHFAELLHFTTLASR